MSHGPSTFRQRDVTRLLKAVRAAGVEVSRVEVDRTGKIVLIPSYASTPQDPADARDDWADAV